MRELDKVFVVFRFYMCLLLLFRKQILVLLLWYGVQDVFSEEKYYEL